MTIDPAIVSALGRAAAHHAGNAGLARACGLNKSTIGLYRASKVREIAEANWSALYPHLRRYLPDGLHYLPRGSLPGADGAAGPTCADGTAPYNCNPDLPADLRRLCQAWPWLGDTDRAMVETFLRGLRPALDKSGPDGEAGCDIQSA